MCYNTYITWPTPSICTVHSKKSIYFKSGMSLYIRMKLIYIPILYTLFYFCERICEIYVITLHSIFLTLILILIILIFYIKFFFAFTLFILLSLPSKVCALYKHICTYVMEANNITRLLYRTSL